MLDRHHYITALPHHKLIVVYPSMLCTWRSTCSCDCCQFIGILELDQHIHIHAHAHASLHLRRHVYTWTSSDRTVLSPPCLVKTVKPWGQHHTDPTHSRNQLRWASNEGTCLTCSRWLALAGPPGLPSRCQAPKNASTSIGPKCCC